MIADQEHTAGLSLLAVVIPQRDHELPAGMTLETDRPQAEELAVFCPHYPGDGIIQNGLGTGGTQPGGRHIEVLAPINRDRRNAAKEMGFHAEIGGCCGRDRAGYDDAEARSRRREGMPFHCRTAFSCRRAGLDGFRCDPRKSNRSTASSQKRKAG